MRKYIIAATLLAIAIPAAAPAWADPPRWAPAHGKRAKYDSHGRYYEPVVITRSSDVWRGSDGQYHCKRSNGTTGLVIGAAVGGLVGHELDGGRDHTTGTIIGAAGGALLGREIARGGMRCQ